MMNKRVKMGGACVLALAMVLAGLKLPSAYAALPVDLTKTGKVEFKLTKNVYQTAETGSEEAGEQPVRFDEELKELPLRVQLYKVADINEAGTYTATTEFGDLAEDVKAVSSKTTTQQWTDMAAAAEAIVEKTLAEDETYTADYIAVKARGGDSFTVESVRLGLYLATVEDAQSDYYTYSFNPYLISVPNNYYYGTGNDAWVYELTGDNAVGLKPERQERLGDLVINKTLSSYNASAGGAYFVYEVSVKRLGEETAETNVYKISFTGAGSDSLTITGLPAGAEVTVKEVYTGASYKLTTEAEQTTTIKAAPDEGDYEPASVSFTNTWDEGKKNGGTGVVNTFYREDGTINWRNDLPKDTNAVEEE